MTLRCVCAWCKRVLCEGSAPVPVTHGICAECLRRELERAEQ